MRLRQEREVKQLALAETVEIDVRTIRSWERGTSRIDLEQFNRLATHLGYPNGRFVELLLVEQHGRERPLSDALATEQRLELLLGFFRQLTPAQRAEVQALLFPRIEITGRDGEPISPADRQAKRGTKC